MTHGYLIGIVLLSAAIAVPAAATTTAIPTVIGVPPAPATTTSTSLAPPIPTPPAQIPGTAATHTQVEALAYMVALDEQLAALAEQALRKPLDPKIRELGVLVMTELLQNAAVTRAVAADAKLDLIDTTEIEASRDQARNDREQLAKTADSNYGSEFLKALTAKGTYALDLIDKRLLSDATDDRIVKHLQASRTRIAAHLLRAQELQSAGQ